MLRLSLIIFLTLLTLTGCGFKPRGELLLAPALHNVYIRSPDPYGQLVHDLKQYLKYSHIHIATCPRNATTILDILKDEKDQQLLSVSGSQQTRQYNLILSVAFQITDRNGCVLTHPLTSVETRTLPIQSNQILAGSNEANTLYNQMYQAIAYDIMNLLASEDVTCCLSHVC